jgi:hypothetical protein
MKTYSGEQKWHIMKIHFDIIKHNESKTKT